MERVGAVDLMELAIDAEATPRQVAGVLVMEVGTGWSFERARGVLWERVRSVRRLRQRMVRVGVGRPVWVDDPGFAVGRHIGWVACPAPGDEGALVRVAAGLMNERLPVDRPLWRATFVTGLGGGRVALVFVVHHVLMDGVGGLAVLARIVDGGASAAGDDRPVGMPGRWELVRDAVRERVRALARVGDGIRALRDARAEVVGGSGGGKAPLTSLNVPTGGRREAVTVWAGLEDVRRAAHAYGGTVNDVLVSAVAGALGTLLRSRGEDPGELVVAISVSGHGTAPDERLGNRVGVLPVRVPTWPDAERRLRRVAAVIRARKTRVPGGSAGVLAGAFRVGAALGLARRIMDTQRRVNTFVTNLRGPAERHTFDGAAIADVIAISPTTGNVTVVFAAFSYAGRFAVTITADPDRCPDLPVLAGALRAELAATVRLGQPPARL